MEVEVEPCFALFRIDQSFNMMKCRDVEFLHRSRAGRRMGDWSQGGQKLQSVFVKPSYEKTENIDTSVSVSAAESVTQRVCVLFGLFIRQKYHLLPVTPTKLAKPINMNPHFPIANLSNQEGQISFNLLRTY